MKTEYLQNEDCPFSKVVGSWGLPPQTPDVLRVADDMPMSTLTEPPNDRPAGRLCLAVNRVPLGQDTE